MIEKVNPSHPDKVADRIAGAIVDLAYKKEERPKVAVEVLIGHGKCHIIAETSVHFSDGEVMAVVHRIMGDGEMDVDYVEVPQDAHLAGNQSKEVRCGDNGIFKGMPVNSEEKRLSKFVRDLYGRVATDGKFIYDEKTNELIICQSNRSDEELYRDACDLWLDKLDGLTINPLGEWTGGTNVDTGATNRKLGSDMGRAVTGGGLHGKDLSKADVAVNIACHVMAQEIKRPVEALCAIGDNSVTFRCNDGSTGTKPYAEVVEMAQRYIDTLGGFEKLAEWGLV